jgi:hypothetical protein
MFSFKSYLLEFNLTLKYHKGLNPEFWYEDKLVEKDREVLINNAYKFLAFSGLEPITVQDIVFTGSSANFNYTKYSDIDIHILVNSPLAGSDELYDKKSLWTENHKNLKIGNYPIEYYIQNAHESFPKGQGVYSLLRDKWLVKPTHLKGIAHLLQDPKTIEKVKYNIHYAKELLKNGTKSTIDMYKEKLRKMRQAGLDREGEFSVENIVYKELRNRHFIDKLNNKLEKFKHNS